MSDKLSRREFFKKSGGIAAGAGLVTGTLSSPALAATAADAGNTVLPFPRKALGGAAQMAVGQAIAFSYPDDSSPCTAIRIGAAVEGGVGPDRDIVAYSTLCTHMGCPVAYDAKSRCFKCPCHFSTFDAEKGGQMVCGQATEEPAANRPRLQRLDRQCDRRRGRRPDLRPSIQHPVGGRHHGTIQGSRGASSGQRAEDQPDLPLLHRRLRLPRLQVGREPRGRTAPDQNALGLDFRKQVPPLTQIMTPAMTQPHRGLRRTPLQHHDPTRQGLHGESGPVVHARRTDGDLHVQPERRRQGAAASHRVSLPAHQWVDTTWEDALAIYCGVAKKILDKDGPAGLVFDCFDHGGAGGGFENTWGTGKLMFTALQTPMVRIHNRPAYNSECHATRDMGVGELNNSYEDAEVADCIMGIGANRTRRRPTISWRIGYRIFRAARKRRSKKWFPSEPLPPTRAIFVDPRRTTTIAIASRSRQGPRAASRHRARHRHRAVQWALHLCGRPGVDRPRFHRQEHDATSTPRLPPTSFRSTNAVASPASRSPSYDRRRSGPTSPRLRASAQRRCTRMKRASSGATTTT